MSVSMLSGITVGFVGLGVMGKSMALNLLRAGYPLVVYNRTKSRADELIQAGATWADTVGAVTSSAKVVITMVGLPSDVEEIYFQDGGILENAHPGTFVIDMTTSTPSLARRIYEAARVKDIHALDAPVSGGDVGARDGKLSIMVGGNPEDFTTVLPIFQAMGTNIVLQGQAGSGQHTKMSNQIAIASNMLGVAEAMAYAKKAGLDPLTVLESIGSGAAGSWSLNNLAPRMIQGDFRPGFYIKHFLKDMKIAIDSAKELGLSTPGLILANSMYERLAALGEELSGTQAIFQLYDDSASQ